MGTTEKLKYALIAAFSAETFCITYGLRSPQLTPVFSFIYFFSGIAIALLLLRFPQSALTIRHKDSLIKPSVYKLAFVALFAALLFFMSKYWFDAIPVDIQHADMLPIMKKMNERFVSGQIGHVYDIIPEIWNGTRPIYLPGTWMPFSPAVYFHFDMRWITATGVWFAFSVSFFILRNNQHWIFALFTTFISFQLFWWLMTENETHGLISVSEEGIAAAYYVLLALALLSQNVYLAAVAISLCMLSRYALIGWIPAYGLFLLLNKKNKQLLTTLIIGILLLMVLLILPFGWQTFVKLMSLPGDYIDFSRRVWRDSPDVFSGSMGFAKFFGPSRVVLQHELLILMTFLAPLAFVIYCQVSGKKRRLSNIPLAALKFGLVFFYSFIDVPYLYLFYTSSFISLAAVSYFVTKEVPAEENVAYN